MNFKQKIEKLKNDSEFKKILTNMNWLFLDKFVQMGVAFFVSIAVIRYLGPEKYGILSYTVALVAFFSVFSKLGLDSIVVRELVSKKFKMEKLLGTVFYLKLLGGFSAVVLATAMSFVLKEDVLITGMTAIVAVSLILQSTDIIDYWFQSKVVSKHIAYSRSIACIISAVVKIWLISVNASLVWFAFIISIEAALIAIGFIFAYFKNRDNIGKWKFDKNIVKSLLKDSWPLILSAISIIIYMKIDQVMIGDMLGYEALGNYSVAVGLGEMSYFIPVVITASVFPAIIKAKKHSEKLYYDRLQKLYDIIIWIAVIIIVPITFFSDQIISLLYGEQYIQAGSVLTIYIWAGIFVFLGVASGKWLVAENLQIFSSVNTMIGAMLNVVLNLVLIKQMGINGAAWATLIAYAFSAYILLFLHNKTKINFLNLSKSLFFVSTIKRFVQFKRK